MQRLWFETRRYGWGWTPASPEGWLVVAVFLVAVGASAAVFVYRLRQGSDPTRAITLFIIWIAILAGVLIAVCWLTGERPRWRWGD